MYMALPVLAAAAASTISSLWVLLLIPSFVVAMLKREQVSVWMAVLAVTAGAYAWFETGKQPGAPVPIPEAIVMADKVSAKDGLMKGFARDDAGNRWYVTYRFRSDEEGDRFFQQGVAGHRFLIRGDREEADPPAHPYAFDMEAWLHSEGADGILRIQEARHAGRGPGWVSAVRRWREALGHHIRVRFPDSVAAEAEALIIGERSAAEPEDTRAYRRLGITHLFAISGLHVGILIYLLREGLLRLGVRTNVVRTGLMLFLPVYALLAGGAPPVWRAVLISLMLLIPETKAGKPRLDLLLCAGMILFLLIDPHAVSKPGFQMSYIAAFALIHSSTILSSARSVLQQAWLVTVICQVAVTPVLLYHFFETSTSSLIANLLFVPLFSVVILPANLILLVLTFLLPPLAEWLFTAYVPLREWLGNVILKSAELPWSVWTPGRPDAGGLLLIVIAIIGFFLLLEIRKPFQALSVLLIICFTIHFRPYVDPEFQVTFIDVGQGDAALVELPYRRSVILIDTGGRLLFGGEDGKKPFTGSGIGERVVVPYLKGRGISKIDQLILSHPDADHAEGADEVLSEIRIGEIHIGPGTYDHEGYANVMASAKKKGIPVIEKKEGDGWKEEGAEFRYLSPLEKEYEGNNDSLVLHINHEGIRILFTGDLEEEGEKRIIDKHGGLFPVTILKAGHHGSRTSSSEAFIQAVSPQAAIFSSGRNNRYGHPHPEVVDRFIQAGIPLASTAEFGTITYAFRKGKLMDVTYREAEKPVP